MNFQFYVEKLFASKSFEDFKKEFPKAICVSGFFVFDLENEKKPDNKQHFDYYDKETDKLYSFKLEDDCNRILIEVPVNAPKLEEIGINYNFDFNEIESLIRREMEEKKITSKIQKILVSMQNLKGKDYLVGTIFISGFGIIQTTIDINEMKIKDFEKKSFLDMMRVIKKD
jgi:hypothetical protein